MKRITLVTIVTVLCLGLVSTAFAGCPVPQPEAYTVFMPKYTETTTTTYGCYQTTAVTITPYCQPTTCQPTACQPDTCEPCPCDPCEPDPCQPCGPSECSIKLACNNIRAHANSVLDLLDRELEGSGWVRLKNAKRVLNKTNRTIYSVTFKNEDTDEKITCYLIVRTPYATISRNTGCTDDFDLCDECGQSPSCCTCQKKQAKKCVPYFTMFTWNYNTGCRAREYDDDWLITGWDQYADTAVREFVNKLVSDQIARR